jgi:hypothetical protein
MTTTTPRRMSVRRQMALLAQLDAQERATRPACVVTPGAGSDMPRVNAIRERLGLPVANPNLDDDDLIDR